MRKKNKTLYDRNDLCSGPFLPKIIRYTLPIIATSLLQLLFNAADLVVVGQYEGNHAVSAVGATSSLINLLVNLFMGLSIGAGVCVAQGVGAKDHEALHKAVHTAIPAAVICGAFLTVVGMVFCPWMLKIMDTPENVIGLSIVYIRIYFAGIIPILLYNFGAAILRSAGDTKSPLIYLTVAGVINVILNLFFVFVLKMSVAGVALATTISQTISCVLVLRALMRREDGCKLNLRQLKIHGKTLGRIIGIGLPAGIQSSLFSISNVIIQSSINSFGDVVLSGSTAASNIEGFVYVSMNSFQQTVTTFAGQNLGAGKPKNIGRITALCLGCVTVVGIVLGVGCYLGAPWLLPIYLKDGGEAVQYGIIRMSYICMPYFLCGIMDIMSGVLRGMGAATIPMIVCILGVCVLRVGWIATVFQSYHTLDCLFLSYPISWVVTFAALLVFFFVIWKRRVRQHTHPAPAGTTTG